MVDLKALKQRFEQVKTIDDLVLAILFKCSNNETIPKSNAHFQKAFYELRQHAHGLLDSLVFDCSSYIPYSEELASAFYRLEASRILSTANPSYQYYAIHENRHLFQKAYDKFTPEQKEIIDSLGEALREKIMIAG